MCISVWVGASACTCVWVWVMVCENVGVSERVHVRMCA